MITDTLLQKIVASARISEMMAWPIDFDVAEPLDDSWFQIRPDIGRQAIAQDGTGGIFAFLGSGTSENRPVLFISSEGQAGLIATTLSEALQLMIALPHWRNCLKFSGGGKLEEMQRVVPFSELEIREDEPDIDALRAELFNGLGLIKPINALEKLHSCLCDTSYRYQILATDDSEFASLFGDLIIEDNPSWKVIAPAASRKNSDL